MANERKAGKKPKFKKDVKLVRIQTKVPEQIEKEVKEIIEEKNKPYLFKTVK